MKRINCAIIGQGGAGGINYPQRRRNGLIKAVSIGYGILMRSGSSLDAVEKAVEILENTTVFNAGTGSALNFKGEPEMDASIMTNELGFGAVAAIKNVKNPINVARLVMEKTDHLLLCGKGAIKFARLMDIKYYNPKTKEKERAWKKKRNNLKSAYFKKLKKLADLYETISIVAIDKNGLISVGISTGGITLRLPGRIGDTPIIGAGIYADKNGVVSATGHGEEIMRYMIAFRAVSLMARYPAQTAGKKVIDYATKNGCKCGLIGIDKKGMILCVNNTKAMSWCYIKNGKMKLFKY
ncbi:isoaspartyl peptidase/L-asparaginase [candidate division WOR-3 bacterium]|nr:isoaspartyl peptidase/L-asparaginase [candidate division WOR-3 bacterium]